MTVVMWRSKRASRLGQIGDGMSFSASSVLVLIHARLSIPSLILKTIFLAADNLKQK